MGSVMTSQKTRNYCIRAHGVDLLVAALGLHVSACHESFGKPRERSTVDPLQDLLDAPVEVITKTVKVGYP